MQVPATPQYDESRPATRVAAVGKTSSISLNRELLHKIKGSNNIPALDAIRGVAALMVVVAHTLGPRQLGSMAVAIFFVLSGFLITWLLVRESEVTGRVSLRDFYVRRTLRIFPAFYVFWFVCVGAAATRGIHILWREAWFSFFYLGDYYSALSHIPGGIMGITWSLGVEEKFYLLWPFLFATLHRNPQKLFRLGWVPIVVIWLYRCVVTVGATVPPDYLRYAFESRFDNILFGCALALGFKLEKIEPILVAANRFSILPVILAASLAGLTFLEEHTAAGYHYIVGMDLDAIIIATMLMQFVFLAALRGWSWLNHPVLRFFGRISYSVYLYHILAIATVSHYLPQLRMRWSYPLIYCGTIAAAYTSFRLIEKPFLRLKDRFAPDRRQAPAKGSTGTFRAQ